MKSAVTRRGQVTIPAEIRAQLGIEPGNIVEFALEGDHIAMRKVDALDALAGISDLQMTTEEFMEDVRGPREV